MKPGDIRWAVSCICERVKEIFKKMEKATGSHAEAGGQRNHKTSSLSISDDGSQVSNSSWAVSESNLTLSI